ncbi:hypothetical protein CVT25_006636 [Psilocybe cyanescens]|uniref:Integrase catalytic domain-containing protein n=1 Tax=Psilocybe cyanescens TaxID=93625 RepID=A0A409XTR9_PSICY|nr:hypothetical protein CVT25_006636 [Psilocybe cyanescens]
MSVPYPESDVVHHILRGLPSSQSWTNFKQLMVQLYQDHMDREKAASDDGKDTAAPDTLLDRIVSRLLIECHRIEAESPSKRNGPGSEYSNLAKDSDNRPIAKHLNNPNGVRCTNCRGRSHDRDHCFNPGGGMAGQGPRDKAAAAAAAAATATVKKDGKEMASIAAASVDFLDEGEISCAMIESVDDNLSTLALTSIPANAMLLDSGATSHLIKSRKMFHSYSEADARNVTTANLGTLRTQGGGTCYVNVSYKGRSIRLKLNNCLHAPGAAVNLLSVGHLNSAGVGCNFIPNEGIRLSKNGITFASGHMINRLFSLDAEFIPGPPSDERVMFVKVPESMYLHHLRLGHPGESATRTLVKSLLKSQIKDVEPIKCEPCIIAKHVATPHPSKSVGQRTYSPLELLLGDTCGPFPIETPHRKKYFVAFRCTGMKVSNLQLIADKVPDTMLEAFITVKERWEKRTGFKVKHFRCDGGTEWKGAFTQYLNDHGIEMEVTPRCEHWMNGEIERFMRTVQGRILAMLTTAQLPLTYWGEAALTAAYLLNVTTLNTDGITLFEAMYSCPPNLSHLHIWGSRCFVHVPEE